MLNILAFALLQFASPTTSEAPKNPIPKAAAIEIRAALNFTEGGSSGWGGDFTEGGSSGWGGDIAD